MIQTIKRFNGNGKMKKAKRNEVEEWSGTSLAETTILLAFSLAS